MNTEKIEEIYEKYFKRMTKNELAHLFLASSICLNPFGNIEGYLDDVLKAVIEQRKKTKEENRKK